MDLLATLTNRQREIFDLIFDLIQTRGYGPTVREIGDHCGISSPNGVVCHLNALQKKGLIWREENRSRAIQITDEALEAMTGLPLVGLVAAGSLTEAIEQAERIDFGGMFNNSKGNLFVLQVTGNSMIEAQIADGDYVVMRKCRKANKGDIVVAMTDEGEATLKQWMPEPSRKRVKLVPANKRMKPIIVKNPKLLGTLVGVVRKV